jgi:hypothetical protein
VHKTPSGQFGAVCKGKSLVYRSTGKLTRSGSAGAGRLLACAPQQVARGRPENKYHICRAAQPQRPGRQHLPALRLSLVRGGCWKISSSKEKNTGPASALCVFFVKNGGELGSFTPASGGHLQTRFVFGEPFLVGSVRSDCKHGGETLQLLPVPLQFALRRRQSCREAR